MPAKAKTLIIWVVVIFLIYAIVSNPEGSANVVEAIWDFIKDAFTGFGEFFGNLTS